MLDTHIALWAIQGDRRLTKATTKLIADQQNHIVISAVTIWEITIKFRLSRGRHNDIPISGPDALQYFQLANYSILPVTADHAIAVALLPDYHSDPFDRLMIAQALHESLRLITHDAIVKTYSDSIMLV